MTTASTRATTAATKRNAPMTHTTTLHPRIGFRDAVRLALFLIIPVYTRICISPSISSIFWHVYAIGTTGICMVYFSKENIGLNQVGDVVYGVLVSSFPTWDRSLPLIAWIMPEKQGWRGEVVYWVFVARQLTYLLPEWYGNDVELLSREYKYACPRFDFWPRVVSGVVVYCALWPTGYSWYSALIIWENITSATEFAVLAYLNYTTLCESGRTFRQNSWPYKDMFMNEFTWQEMLEWHTTGGVRRRRQEQRKQRKGSSSSSSSWSPGLSTNSTSTTL